MPSCRLSAVLAGLISAFLLISASATAEAAYPGCDGRIAFVRHGDVFTVRPDGSSLRRLTFTATAGADGLAAAPAWSPDGRLIAYQSRRSGSWDIWVMDAGGGGKHRITSSSSWQETGPTWSPDGRWIAFISDRYTDPSDPNPAVFKIRSTAPYGSAIRLTRPGIGDAGLHQQDWAPAWSPLGSTIMFSRITPYGGQPDGVVLYTVPSGGGPVTRVDTGFGDAWLGDWAPRGRAIAWSSDADSPDQFYEPPIDIWQRRADGGLSRVTPAQDGVKTFSPAWAPSGTRLAYERLVEPSTRPSIWTISPDGTHARLVVDDGHEPDWQPLVG